MRNKIKYMSEALFILLFFALVLVGRSTALFVILPTLCLVGLELNQKKWNKHSLHVVLQIVLAAVVLWAFNDIMAIGKAVGSFDKVSLLNFLIYFMLFLLAAGCIKKLRIALLIPEILLIFIGILNAVIKAIRRTPISAGDIFSVKTAMAVAGNYSMEFDKEFILKLGAGIVLVALMLFILHCYAEDKSLSFACRISMLTVSVAWFVLLTVTSWGVNFSGKHADYFTHETNGFAWNLYLQLKDLYIREPEEYTPEKLAEITNGFESDSVQPDQDYPNIIVIMNESFSDLSVLGEFETNMEVLPVLNSLEENTIKGNLYPSVYGGNTANSEYEFLTGSSISYFSERVVPFQLYMNEKRDSVISQMNTLGYDTVFMHCYLAYSWNRPSVYAALQTNRMYYEEDMPNLVNIRGYASDESQNEYLIGLLEDENRTQPLFLYDVTVQNHGGYTTVPEELEEKITITGQEGKFPETENYLTLAHESDRALGELLTYLENYEEPTVVLFFGDHQPAIESEFIAYAMGKSQSDFTLEDRQKMYTVPFFLWTNYDIEEKEVDKLSINYLSTFLCHELGLPMTGFQKYLLSLSESFPVINTVSVVDETGACIDKNELAGEQQKAFQEYQMLIYNYMFDSDSKLTEFYTLQTR